MKNLLLIGLLAIATQAFAQHDSTTVSLTAISNALAPQPAVTHLIDAHTAGIATVQDLQAVQAQVGGQCPNCSCPNTTQAITGYIGYNCSGPSIRTPAYCWSPPTGSFWSGSGTVGGALSNLTVWVPQMKTVCTP